MDYIDMHCDTLGEALVRKQKTIRQLEGAMLDVGRLQRSGAVAQFFAMFLPQRKEPFPSAPETDACREAAVNGAGGRKSACLECEAAPELSARMENMYGIYQNTLLECGGTLAWAGSGRDLKRNGDSGKISAFLTIENGEAAQGSLENIEKFYHMGVRLITLTWNDENCLGFPHSEKREQMRRGLKDFGKEAVAYMEALGMLVDVSHLSDGGFYDVADILKKPFVASHSNCRALAPASRNLTDEMIKKLAERGGVAGINFAPAFLNRDPKDPVSRIERMCDHAEHFIRIGGEECVGIGTDFDGISGQLEISDCTQMERFFAALRKRGISERVVEKIARRNVERVICEVM